ncbi:two-component sensor histidine kinase [Caulobacter ginsengisoli]|uniref:histidine kinase n=1 Tax=Caulobacter ginsengisoli TaxID=400775 RepID=A0ABU0IX27_9CAUL|nr:HWE histidine kinase domain-containing protein [Caulobacter ginsengisoli]MDQ0466535.1 two-component sensor histidine kinase [Caulobacter ginsengisoli]
MDSFTRLLDTHGMLPHGFCLLWQPGLLALHVISDLVIAAAYFSIPLAILAFVRRRTDLIAEHRRIAILFVLFILGCGLTHVMGIVVLWRPAYWTDGVIKGLTAAVSLITAIALWPVVPRLLAVPSPEQLANVNASLMAEVAARRTALEELGAVRANLEAEIQHRTAEVQALARRFQIATEGSVVTLFEQDEALRFTWLHNPRPPFTRAVLGRTGDECLSAEAQAVLRPLKEQVLASGEPLQAEVALPMDDHTGHFEIRVTPAAAADGSTGLLVAAVDISEQKRQQDHLQVILRELAHRSRNLLSMVDGIARQTAKAEGVPKEFSQRFGARLTALGQAYDLLISHDWRGVDLDTLARSQLAHLAPEAGDRLRIEGPSLDVGPETGQYLALAIHELATNAAKYGALSELGGQITLSWRRLEGPDGAPRIEVTWDETLDRPMSEAPAGRRRGFGRLLLEQLTPRAVKGQASLVFEPQAVRWHVGFPA